MLVRLGPLTQCLNDVAKARQDYIKEHSEQYGGNEESEEKGKTHNWQIE